MVILKESYASYENKPAAPCHHDVNGGFTMPTARRWRDEALNNAQQFLKMQLFRAALPAELRKVVAQRNPNTLNWTTCTRLLRTLKGRPGPGSRRQSRLSTRRNGSMAKEMTKSRPSRRRRVQRMWTGRRAPILRRGQAPRGIPPTTKATQDLEASTVNCKITHRKIVLKGLETKKRVKTDRVVLIGPECT